MGHPAGGPNLTPIPVPAQGRKLPSAGRWPDEDPGGTPEADRYEIRTSAPVVRRSETAARWDVALVVRRPNEGDRRALSAAQWAAGSLHARHLLVCVDEDRPRGVLIGEGSGLPWYFALWQTARGGWARASHAIRGSHGALPASMAMRNCSLLVDPSAGDRADVAAALIRYVNGAS